MNVLFISNDPALFDPQSAVRARMRAYASEIGDLHILSRGSRTEDIHEENLHLYSLKAPKILSPFLLASRAHKLICERGIEIVSAQDPFEHGWAAWRAVRNTEAKLHIQIHTDFLSPWFRSPVGASSFSMRMLNRLRIPIADRVLPHAAGIRVVSKRISTSLSARYGSRIPEPSVLPLPVLLETAERGTPPPAPFTFTILSIARLEPEKRLEDALYALRTVSDTYPDVGLYIAGSGRLQKSLQRLAQRLGLSERVVFLGHCADVRGLLLSADVFIQTSAYEGYGLTFIEAALAGVPIVTTDVGVVGDVLVPGIDVLTADVGNTARFAEHLISLYENPELRVQLTEHAQAHAIAHQALTATGPRAIAEDLAQLLP